MLLMSRRDHSRLVLSQYEIGSICLTKIRPVAGSDFCYQSLYCKSMKFRYDDTYMKNGLERAGAHVNEHGLPSIDQMRNDIEANEKNLFREKIQVTLSEYTELFNRFKTGGSLSGAEASRMADLSDELSKLSEGIQGS